MVILKAGRNNISMEKKMKTNELKPTYDNLINTLTKDTIGRNLDVFALAEFLDTIENACSIAIDGSWGSGKTFFVKQTKMIMDAHNNFVTSINKEDKEKIKNLNTNLNLQPHVCVYYDAWENDNDNDPVLSLVYSIIKSVDTDYAFRDDIDFIQKAATILEFFTGRNWADLITNLKGTNALEEIRKNKSIENDIKEFLESLLLEKGNRLVVFVDELDRCKPSYAVKLLERIKHYFDNERITFVFSINTSELQHTIKKYYGNDFDACKYLDRFFDFRLSIPPVNKFKFYASIEFDEGKTIVDSICADIIEKYNFSMRETTRFLTDIKRIFDNPKRRTTGIETYFPDGKAKQMCIFYILPIIVGLSISNREIYENFINGKDSSPLIEILSKYEVYRFRQLLSKGESFEESAELKKVSISEKLTSLYNAVFNTTYTYDRHELHIGECTFTFETKKTLFEVASSLSK